VKYVDAVAGFFLAMVLHWLWSTHLTVFGLAPQFLLISTVVVAGRSGPVAGQCYGFAWGLFLDLLSGHVFGANALCLTLAAYGVGMLRRQMDVGSLPPQAVLVALLTPVYLVFYGLTGTVFEHRFLWAGWKVFLLTPVYNCLALPLGYAFVRKFVRL